VIPEGGLQNKEIAIFEKMAIFLLKRVLLSKLKYPLKQKYIA
jgi:16S rRNA U1498 N3-methylase RsmE